MFYNPWGVHEIHLPEPPQRFATVAKVVESAWPVETGLAVTTLLAVGAADVACRLSTLPEVLTTAPPLVLTFSEASATCVVAGAVSWRLSTAAAVLMATIVVLPIPLPKGALLDTGAVGDGVFSRFSTETAVVTAVLVVPFACFFVGVGSVLAAVLLVSFLFSMAFELVAATLLKVSCTEDVTAASVVLASRLSTAFELTAAAVEATAATLLKVSCTVDETAASVVLAFRLFQSCGCNGEAKAREAKRGTKVCEKRILKVALK